MAKSSKFIVSVGSAMYIRQGKVAMPHVKQTKGFNTRLNVDGMDFADTFFRITSPTFRAAFFARMRAIQVQKDTDTAAHVKAMTRGAADERR